MDSSQKVQVMEYGGSELVSRSIAAIRETSLHIFVNGERLVNLAFTGKHPEYLTAGFLLSCGIIETAKDITSLEITELLTHIEARVQAPSSACLASVPTRTSGLGWNVPIAGHRAPAFPSPGRARWPLASLLRLAEELEARCALHRETRGCHNAALCTAGGIVLFREDIGRHNAIDMLAGQCLLDGLDPSGMGLVCTGRVALEIVQKVVRAKIPLLASFAVATSAAVASARTAGLCLVGNMRANKLWIYHNNGLLDAATQSNTD